MVKVQKSLKLYGVLTLIVVFSFVGIVFALNVKEQERQEKEDTLKQVELFADALALVKGQYVTETNSKDLIYAAIEGMMSSLDPYSQFLTPDDYKELLVNTEGEFGGLGIEIALRNKLLTVISPIEGTPAWKAGLKPLDIVVKIDEELTKGITLPEAVKKLRGKPGTSVKLTVLRENEKELKEYTLTREIIKIKDIKHAEILEDGIAYVKLLEFRENTSKDLDTALQGLEKNMKGLILDLRNNPGGLLSSAVEIASKFIDKDKLIVYTQSRDDEKVEYQAIGGKKYLKVPMIILINSGSASASEIVAGALRDYKRGVLVGEKSFGKGSVQTVVPLVDKAALRITTSHYYTPSGRIIQKEGLTPDIVIKEEVSADDKNKEDEVFEKIAKEKKDEKFYKKDLQLRRAIDIMKGIMLLSADEAPVPVSAGKK